MHLMFPQRDLSYKIIAAAIEVHRNLGPGLLESVYRLCMESELRNHGLQFQRELGIPLFYKERELNQCFRLDFLVENEVVLELKSVEVMLPVHNAQLLTYLKLTRKQIGLLINFNVPVLKDGVVVSLAELTLKRKRNRLTQSLAEVQRRRGRPFLLKQIL